MDEETAVITFQYVKKGISCDLEVPVRITANEFVAALNQIFSLGFNTGNFRNFYLKAERPIAFLRGNKTLAEFGICNGSVISYTE